MRKVQIWFVFVLALILMACTSAPVPTPTQQPPSLGTPVATQTKQAPVEQYLHWHWKGVWNKPLSSGLVSIMTLEGDRDEVINNAYCPKQDVGWVEVSCEKTQVERRAGIPPTPIPSPAGPVTLKAPIPITQNPEYCQGLQLPTLAKSETQNAGPNLDIQILGFSTNGDPYIEFKRKAQDVGKMLVAEVYVLSNLQKPIYLTLDPMVYAVPPREKVCVRTYFVRPGRTPMPGGVEKVVFVPTSMSNLIGFVVPEHQ